MPSPYKLRIHRWAEHRRVSLLTAQLAQGIAVSAEMVYELMAMLRGGQVDSQMPPRPPAAQWLGMYDDREQVFLAACDAMPGMIGSGDDVRELLHGSRALSTQAKNDPAAIKTELESINPQRLMRRVRAAQRLEQRGYRHHLICLQELMDDEDAENDAQDFGEALATSPELCFFFRVTLPCVVIHRRFPVQLLRKAKQGDIKAIEALVRVDDLAAHHPIIEAWASQQPGNVRQERLRQLRHWAEQGLDHGQFSRKQVKQLLAGLIAAQCEQMGMVIDFSTGQTTQGKLTARDICDLFNAVAQDRAGRTLGVVDEDLAEDQIESFSRRIRPYKQLWRNILPGGPKFA